ncbi:FUSC family protein [Vibrio superstes]|uniref:Fusaric acid resistance protein n=1 Tax=Vibrio superstes NBRC 103154 TaxID=1219062 RepID=A0A511QKE1_9VIBR|nr:FUSC family protein [Vibrio superstes]GEM77759.1 hypothetical protein VSU01S_00040 [Vibrio superstes NBRC 103154]
MMLVNLIRQWSNPDSVTFALRFCLAVMLTWMASLLLDSQATGTAMMTAAIIQITGNRGASFKKSAARLAGTVIGGMYVLFVASVTMIDAWLFNSFIILGIVVSLGISSYFHRRVAYMFAVVGITLSLVGFPIAAEADLTNLFDHVQLRCIGISFGILMSMLAGFIIPYADDKRELLFVKGQTDRFIAELFHSEASKVTKLIRAFLSLVGKKWLAVDDEIYGSEGNRSVKQKSRATFYDCINIGVQAIELRKLGDAIGMSKEAWQNLEEDNFELDPNSDFVTRWELSDLSLVDLFVSHATDFSKQLKAFKQQEVVYDYSETKYVDDINSFTDGYLVLCNMARAAFALFLLSFMWIELQWTDGMSAIIMAGMISSVYAANPGAEGAFSTNVYAQFVAGAFAFLINFIIMPIGSPVIMFITGFVGVYIMAYGFWQSRSLLKVVFMVSLFSWSNLVPLTNVPSYDFAHFLNSVLANLVGLLVLWTSYQLLPSRKTADVIKKRLTRLIKRLKQGEKNVKTKININNLILSSYSFLIDESDDDSVFTLLYTKALTRILDEEELSVEQRKLLLSSLDKNKKNLVLNQNLTELIEDKMAGKEQVRYNWFALSRLLNA